MAMGLFLVMSTFSLGHDALRVATNVLIFYILLYAMLRHLKEGVFLISWVAVLSLIWLWESESNSSDRLFLMEILDMRLKSKYSSVHETGIFSSTLM